MTLKLFDIPETALDPAISWDLEVEVFLAADGPHRRHLTIKGTATTQREIGRAALRFADVTGGDIAVLRRHNDGTNALILEMREQHTPAVSWDGELTCREKGNVDGW